VSFNPEDSVSVPMSLRMKRVLAAIKRMSPAESFQLFVRAGLMSEAEAEAAAARHSSANKVARKTRSRRRQSVPRDTKSLKN
jgi:hypothetical protein